MNEEFNYFMKIKMCKHEHDDWQLGSNNSSVAVLSEKRAINEKATDWLEKS